ncbi:hypothetical protein RB195_025034 [Necator americanus]|uniref:Uncharacterized protein n=1 Tax=Necator americanus TaxID=51031 RepID=A0ABR1EQL0_NECAM
MKCAARNHKTGDFNQEKRLRRKLRRQLQQDRDNGWKSRTKEFEKAWKDKNPQKATKKFEKDIIEPIETRRCHMLNAVYETGELFFGTCDSGGVGGAVSARAPQ